MTISAALIGELIDKQDNFELVRDQIAAILAVETLSQQAKALAAGKNAALWAFKVYSEASNPIADYIDAPEQLAVMPIVNVTNNQGTFDYAASDTIERQKADATFYIDCYGYGVSADSGNPLTGHTPGDRAASLEAQRVYRLVRNIIMAGAYTYLAFPRGGNQVVWGRRIQGWEVFQPEMDERPIEHVMGVRATLQVTFNEFSPQVQGEPLEIIAATVKRAGDGLILLDAQYDVSGS